ncbi:MAG: substrate-binding domain-containing protein [Prolixibacteraceae bacterium]|nr:substrate-binding domain-containing protein [Prolixibacteraceae bacterium]
MNRILMFVILATMILSGTACRRAKKEIPSSMLTGQVTIAADEALQPLLNAEIDVFQSIYNYSTVNCQFVTEYDAINQLLQEKIRLALVTRPLNQEEISFFESKNIIPESIPIAFDAIAVVVNSENKTQALTTNQLSGILSGEIVDWSQLKVSGISGGIKLFFDSEASGIIRSLNDSLRLNKKISGDIQFAGNSQNVLERVASTPESIGFVGFNLLSEAESTQVKLQLEKLKLLAVSKSEAPDSTNSFKPSIKSLFDQNYPLTRKVYALYTDPSAGMARGFLAHLTSERGQKIIYRMGLKPESDFQRLVNIKSDF